MTQTDVLPLASPRGSTKTKRFYDEVGWKSSNGRTVDVQMFGATEVGPIRERTHALRIGRIRAAFAKAGPALNLIEVGCGAAPSLFLADLCRHMTCVDFSDTGIREAEAKLAAADVPHETRTADACDLPYPTASFDAAFSSHMLYHIPDPAAQSRAIAEIMRVLTPGGTAVFVLANPWPLLFPVRLLRRLLGLTPGLSTLLNRLRRQAPLPYRPMSIAWTQRQLSMWGSSRVTVYGIPTVWFLQNVTEQHGPQKLLWRAIAYLEHHFPRTSAYLGNFFIVVAAKNP